MNTFDIVSSYIKSHTDVINGNEVVDEEKMEILSEYCDTIDDIMRMFGGTAVEVNTVTKRKYVVVSIEVDTFTAMKSDLNYFALIDQCVCFATCITPEQMVRIDFTFPSVFKT